MIQKLRIKITALVLITCLLLLVVVLGVVFRATKENTMSDALGSMEWVIDDIKTEVYYGIPKGTPRPMAILFRTGDETPILDSVWNMDNVGPNISLPPLAETLLQEPSETGFYTTENGRYLAYRWEALEDGRTVIIMTDVTMNRDAMDAFRKNAFVASGVALVVMLLLGMIFACWVVRPIEQAQAQQSSFFTAASHDLRTPLTIILSNISLLKEELQIEDSQRSLYYSNIESGAHQMKQLIQNMLDYSFFETMAKHRSLPMDTEIDFSHLVQKTMTSFEVLYFEHDRVLQYELESDLHICGNAGALERLIGILLDNALKYSEAHTEITVRLKAIHTGALQFDIRSVSAPIPREECQKIFQAFYRTDESRNDQNSYGLGLSIAKNIVSAHNGSIWVTTESHANTFHITLPRVSV